MTVSPARRLSFTASFTHLPIGGAPMRANKMELQMMNKTWLAGGAGLTLVVVGAVAVAFASDWGGDGWKGKGGRGSHGGGRAVASLLQFDANKDGSITRAEVDAGIQAQFQGADTNSDGRLDAVEFQKYNDARRAERKARFEAWRAKKEAEGGDTKRGFADRGSRGFDPMKNMDWNLDGYIAPDEFADRTRAQVMRADRNGDGTIQADEMKKRGRHGPRDGDKSVPTAPATTAPAPEQQ